MIRAKKSISSTRKVNTIETPALTEGELFPSRGERDRASIEAAEI